MVAPHTPDETAAPRPLQGARIAIAYDCLFPWTVGGAERWYRRVAEAARDAGASVTYLTRRQWEAPPGIPGIDVVAVSRAEPLYDERGVRRLGPTLRYGFGCLRHLVARRHRYDLVHVANFPFWGLLGVRAALTGSGRPVLVDWHEVWSLRFWRTYAGRLTGPVGYLVQRLCLAATPHPVVTSPRNADRLRQAGCARPPIVLPGFLPADAPAPAASAAPASAGPPTVLFAGRHIGDKGVDLLPEVAEQLEALGSPVAMVVAGDGPARPALEAELGRRGLTERVCCVGFVDDHELERLVQAAVAVLVPSRREGYGMLVVEATRHGTPVVVADFEENLAADHVEEGVNGYLASPPTPRELAGGIEAARRGGAVLRASTRAWYQAASKERTVDHSTERIVTAYCDLLTAP